MGTYAKRILSRGTSHGVSVGDRIEVELDRVVLSGVRAPSTLRAVRDLGRPWSSDHLLLTMDFQASEVESEIPKSRALCRDLSKEFGLRQVFDLNTGIGSHVALESAFITPGQLVAGCGRCLGVMGGVGALALRADEGSLAQAIVSGRLSLEVPPVVGVDVQGRLPRHVGQWDLAVAVAAALGSHLSGGVVELRGATEHWGIDFRVALCGLLVEMGARAAVVSPDDATARFYKERGIQDDVGEPVPEGDDYETKVTVEADAVVPMAAAGYAEPGKPLPGETEPQPVQGVFVGGCYGGRYEDLQKVAEVLKRKGQVHPDVRLAVSPASLETARACLAAGFYETFLNAGAMVVVPGGSPGSAGSGAMFGEGERIASTAEYHRHLHPGQGVPEVLVVSAGTAAVAAIEGGLVNPASHLA